MTTIIDGSAGITFPNSTVQASAGSVIQVVSNIVQTNSLYFSTASTSFVSTGFSVTITPKFSTSKIVLFHNAVIESPSAGGFVVFTIYRNNTTNLGTGTSPSAIGGVRGSSSYIDTNMPLNFVDSPATTSATTYTVYMLTTTATAYYGGNVGGASNSNVLSFIAMEIAA
jgi:hypothetical protein